MPQIPQVYVSLIIKFLATIAILIFTILANRVVKSVLKARLQDYPNVHTLRMLARNTVVVIGIGTILFVWLGSGGSFTVAMGILGAGIAFAAQQSIGSFAGYVSILSSRLFQIGERVSMGGVEGDVLDISLLRTTLMEIGGWVKADQYTGRVVTVANSVIFTDPVFNYTQLWPYVWDEIMIPVPYGSDWRHAVEIMLAHGNEYTAGIMPEARARLKDLEKRYPALVRTPVEPILYVVMTDNWVELTMRYVVEARNRRLVKAQLFQELLNHFEAEPELSVASSTYDIVGFPPIHGEIRQTR